MSRKHFQGGFAVGSRETVSLLNTSTNMFWYVVCHVWRSSRTNSSTNMFWYVMCGDLQNVTEQLLNPRHNYDLCIPLPSKTSFRRKLFSSVDRFKLGAYWRTGGRALGHRVLQPWQSSPGSAQSFVRSLVTHFEMRSRVPSSTATVPC